MYEREERHAFGVNANILRLRCDARQDPLSIYYYLLYCKRNFHKLACCLSIVRGKLFLRLPDLSSGSYVSSLATRPHRLSSFFRVVQADEDEFVGAMETE